MLGEVDIVVGGDECRPRPRARWPVVDALTRMIADAADLRGARFTDCDLTGVTIRDGWLVDVSISGYVSNVTVNGVDAADFVSAEPDRRHAERVQLREVQNADGFRAMWDTIERL
jgi:Pentapeptide repeats (8 copies)